MALACEAAGFFYVGVCDHTFIPERLAGAMSTVWYDTVATLGWLAGVTTEIRLLSHIYVAALRHPLRAAKEFATLDVLSAGRVICGVGAGHVAEEFDLMGPAFDERGPATDEAVAGLALGLTEEFPDAARAALAGRRGRAPAPTGAVAPSADLGRRLVAGRPAPHGPLRRRLAAPVGRPQRRAAGRRCASCGPSTATARRSTSGPSPTRCTSAPRRPATSCRRARSRARPSSSPSTCAPTARPACGQVQVRFPAHSVEELCDQIAAFGAEVVPLVNG